MKIGQLDQNLRRFYAEARTKKGKDYSKSTLLGFRHSIERFLNAPPFSRGLQISTDPRFARSNLMLDAQIKNLKRSGKEIKCLAQTCYRGRRPPEAEIKWSVVLVVTAFLAEKRLVSCRPVFLQKGPWRAKKLDNEQLQVRNRCGWKKLRNYESRWIIKESSRRA